MNTTRPFRKKLLLIIVAVLPMTRGDEQTANGESAGEQPPASSAQTETPSPVEEKESPKTGFVSPFSGEIIPDYSYTNRTVPVSPLFANRGLILDPFSRTPWNPPKTEAPQAPKLEPLGEPATPVHVELPPGAYLQAPPSPAPATPTRWPVSDLSNFDSTVHLDLPPGSWVRRK